jgi:hypothetical protein
LCRPLSIFINMVDLGLDHCSPSFLLDHLVTNGTLTSKPPCTFDGALINEALIFLRFTVIPLKSVISLESRGAWHTSFI